MKKKIIYWTLSLLIITGCFSCSDGDGYADYGFAYIYMPQATVSGGLNNNYYVPSGSAEYTYNFKISEDKKELRIILGVLRAGVLPNAAYTVDIITRADTTNQIVESGQIENSMVFPASLYTLPNSVTVPGNQPGESFYMTVPVEGLMMDQFIGKNLVLTVGIANPTAFQLSETNTSTVVILDVDALRRILNGEGGDEEEDENNEE